MSSLGRNILLWSFSAGLLAACGNSMTPVSSPSSDSSSQSTPPPEVTPPSPSPTPSPEPSGLNICSKLNFAQVSWSPSLSLLDRSAFQLALNISGSFEGNTGWANLTNNFDGQGLSMGLLNQTLGTGSLQPLMTKMRAANYTQMQSLFSANHFQSLSQMLQAYGASVQISSLQSFTQNSSPLDQDWQPSLQSFSLSREASSVQWAVSNLYNGNAFKPDWAQELTALAIHPAYVSLQIEAAQQIHNKARSLQQSLGFNDVRSYLLMFDFVVQNGGLDSREIPEYQQAVQKNPSLSLTQKMTTLLELRLRRVKSQFVSDVRSRKMAIINGTGSVHGLTRQLEKEYCYSGLDSYP